VNPSAAETEILRAKPLVEAEWYLAEGKDSLHADPVRHYLTTGWLEGRNPCRFFDTAWYLAQNPEIAARGINPLLHYIESGEAEGRWPCRIFDPVWYSRKYGTALGGGRALAHYLTVGCARNLRPNAVFDPVFYKESHADLREADIEAPIHYLEVGFREDRHASSHFCLATYREAHLGGERLIDPVYHSLTAAKRRRTFAARKSGKPSIANEIRFFSRQGPDFEEVAPVSRGDLRAKLIAFYLPQFHAIQENDVWWGTGFTEWRNTQRGVPRFVGHYQPRVPRDLGFYDLSNPGVLACQIELARHAGIHGFCFYYYNFDGKRLLEEPIEQFLEDHTLEFPFCLMWANENWTRRWDGFEEDVLLEQSYRLENEDALLADWCRHFADPRYIKPEGRPLFLIYRPGTIPNAARTIARWRHKLATEFGQHPWMLMSQSFEDWDPRLFNLDGAFEFPPHRLGAGLPRINSQFVQLDPDFAGTVLSYRQLVDRSLSAPIPDFPLIKALCPSWDNDCRRQGAGSTFHGSSPRIYQRWLERLIQRARTNPFAGEPFLFVNAWNEWAEAAYLEPDVHYGAAYLNATARALVAQDSSASKAKILLVGHDAHRHGAQLNLFHFGRTLAHRFGIDVVWLLIEGGALIDQYRDVGPVTVARPGSDEFRHLLDELRSDDVRYAVTNTLVTGSVVPELQQAGFRVVSLVHELPGLASEYRLGTAAKAIADGSDAIVCAARMVERGFRAFAGAPRGDIHILPQGLYTELPETPGAREAVRSELRLSAKAKIVVGLGFGDRRKGFDLFLRAARLAAKQRDDIAFLWVGNILPKLSPGAVNMPANYRHVGFTDSIGRYLHAADALFLSSREDPFPSVVLEALACGLPVVGFAGRSGTEDLLREYGALVPPFNVAAAVEALRHLMALEGEAASAAAARRRDIVASDFNYDRYAFSLLQLLNPKLPRISVVVPNYNYARYLQERMESIFAQSLPVFEIIVLDDASTDDSIAVLDRARQECRRDFTLIRNPANSGSSVKQWLKGIEQASGDLVWVAEADDTCKTNFLERLLPHFQATQTLFAFSDSAQIDSNGVPIAESYHGYYEQSDARDLSRGLVLNARHFAERYLAVRNLILNVSSVLARRDVLLAVLREVVERRQDFSFAGDWLVYATICLRGGDVAYVPEALNIHRRHRDSATHRTRGDAHIAEIEDVHSYLEEMYGSDESLRLRRRQYIALLREQFDLDARSQTDVAGQTSLLRSQQSAIALESCSALSSRRRSGEC
jgi:glycosyltransferase involved in cell wall biosynthesis